MTTKLSISVAAVKGNVTVMLWPKGGATDGIHTTFHLDRSDAVELASALNKAIATLPRTGTAEDLGVETLP